MQLAEIKRLIQRKPFRPFVVKTVAGMSVLVRSAEHIKLPPPGHKLMVIYNADGLVNAFAESDIASARVR
jgi:hypothetical protein